MIDNEFAHFCGKCGTVIPIGMEYNTAYLEETLPCGKTRTREIAVHIVCEGNFTKIEENTTLDEK